MIGREQRTCRWCGCAIEQIDGEWMHVFADDRPPVRQCELVAMPSAEEDLKMRWTRVNGELMITDRQRSGYEYRIRETDHGVSILIAEGPISGPGLLTRREECPSVSAAMTLADQWESTARA